MTFEIAAAAALSHAQPAAGAAGLPAQVGYGVSLTDFGGFQQAMAKSVARLSQV